MSALSLSVGLIIAFAIATYIDYKLFTDEDIERLFKNEEE